jgi:4-carboxymuconolactone decarboxylase
MQVVKKAIVITLVFCCVGSLLGQDQQPIGHFNVQEKSIVGIAALTAKGDLVALKYALRRGLDSGLPVQKIKECLVHTYAYCGFPRSIRGLQTFMEVLDERKSKGIQDSIGVAASPIHQSSTKYERGKKILNELSKSDRPLPPYALFAPVIDTFLKEHLFADIFERDVLTYAERELVTISVLAAIGRAEPMLRSHYTLCLNVGLTPDQLHEFVQIIGTTLGEKEAASALLALNDVLGIKTTATKPDMAATSVVLPKGEKVTNPNFTGTVWVHMFVQTDTTYDINAGNVTFEPGARTHWHVHPGGQVLLVTSGKGRYQEEGGSVIEIQQGDVIKCTPNVKHWHGAAPDCELSHIAIGTNQELGAVKWFGPVTDKEYRQ